MRGHREQAQMPDNFLFLFWFWTSAAGAKQPNPVSLLMEDC